jgi:hypothetical protein
MLKFLFYFIVLLLLIAGAGLAAWFIYESVSHRHGKHRGKRHRRHHRPATTSWLPIDTFHETQRETRHVLLWVDGDARFGFYDDAAASWRGQPGDPDEPIDPTHWMPLPRPPAS